MRVIVGYVDPDGQRLLAERAGPVFICRHCGSGIYAYAWGKIPRAMIAAHMQRHQEVVVAARPAAPEEPAP